MKNNVNNPEPHITKEGSLGLLALGDIGLRAWRNVKIKHQNNNEKEE